MAVVKIEVVSSCQIRSIGQNVYVRIDSEVRRLTHNPEAYTN